jgi:hypothetical protein
MFCFSWVWNEKDKVSIEYDDLDNQMLHFNPKLNFQSLIFHP